VRKKSDSPSLNSNNVREVDATIKRNDRPKGFTADIIESSMAAQNGPQSA
jgi:hypothetical protein